MVRPGQGAGEGAEKSWDRWRATAGTMALAALPVEPAVPHNPVTRTPWFSAVSSMAFQTTDRGDGGSSLTDILLF